MNKYTKEEGWIDNDKDNYSGVTRTEWGSVGAFAPVGKGGQDDQGKPGDEK